jgi:hypothetical protein
MHRANIGMTTSFRFVRNGKSQQFCCPEMHCIPANHPISQAQIRSTASLHLESTVALINPSAYGGLSSIRLASCGPT